MGSIPTKSNGFYESIMQSQIVYIRGVFASMVQYFFIGFILANIFGNFIKYLLVFVGLPLFLICLLIVGVELSYKFYKKIDIEPFESRTQIDRFFISIRIGLILGFCVDAYKVGS